MLIWVLKNSTIKKIYIYTVHQQPHLTLHSIGYSRQQTKSEDSIKIRKTLSWIHNNKSSVDSLVLDSHLSPAGGMYY